MSSKVFSAKRKTVDFEYEFVSGDIVSLKAQSLSSKEQQASAKAMQKKSADLIDTFKDVVKQQLILNDKKIVERVIKDQYEEGDVIEFSNTLGTLIREEKEKK